MSKKNYNIAWPQGARINRRRQYLPRHFSADEAVLVEHYPATAAALRRRRRKAGTQMQIPANAKTTPARAGAEYPKPAAITAPPMIAPAALAVFSAAWLRAAPESGHHGLPPSSAPARPVPNRFRKTRRGRR